MSIYKEQGFLCPERMLLSLLASHICLQVLVMGNFWQLNLSLAFVFWPHAVRLDLSLRVWECSVVSLWRVGVTGVVRFLPKCSLRFNVETCQAVRHPQQIIAKNWTVDKSPLKRRHSSCQCFAKKVYNHEITSTHVFKRCCNEGVIRHIYTYVYVKYFNVGNFAKPFHK